jgi:hypothetical protein
MATFLRASNRLQPFSQSADINGVCLSAENLSLNGNYPSPGSPSGSESTSDGAHNRSTDGDHRASSRIYMDSPSIRGQGGAFSNIRKPARNTWYLNKMSFHKNEGSQLRFFGNPVTVANDISQVRLDAIRCFITEGQLHSAIGYAYYRGNGQYTRLIPVDEIPSLKDIPASQGPQGLIILPIPGTPTVQSQAISGNRPSQVSRLFKSSYSKMRRQGRI